MQPVNPNSPTASQPSPAVLPEFWPDQFPATVRPVWLPWPLAVALAPLFWLMPKRFGPHFAQASWTAAILAHILWVSYAAASIVMPLVVGPHYTLASWLLGRTPEQMGQSLFPVPTFGEMLRGPLAFLVTMPAQAPLMGTAMPPTMVSRPIVNGLLADLAGVLALGALVAPFVAAGERPLLLFGRAVKLVLWASTSAVVLALVVQVLALAQQDLSPVARVLQSIVFPGREPAHSLLLLACALYSAWFIWLVVRGGSRYAGPREGPVWEPAGPLCAGCGYGLTGLPAGGSCPECGKTIAESLPPWRRPSPFAVGRGFLDRLTAYPRTYWIALRGRGFYDRLATRDGLPAARRFAVWTAVISAISLLVLNNAILDLLREARWNDPLEMVVAGTWLSLALTGLIGLIALLVSRFGRRPMQRHAIAAFYWSVWFLPLGTSGVAAFAGTTWLLERPYFVCLVDLPGIGRIDLYVICASLLLIVPLVVLWRAVVSLGRAARAVAYANA